MVDFESMTLGLSDASPCGDSLDYDPVFADLEIAARGKPEQHFGATLVPAQEPDWRHVQAKALALFERTRDLRVAVLLARAQTLLDGLPALTSSLELIRQLLTRHWDHVHPQLDPEDQHDPILRMNALAALVDPMGLLRDLRNVAFVQSAAAGTCSIRDAELAIGIVRLSDEQAPPVTRAQLTALVRAHAAAGGKNEAQRAFETAGALRSVLVEKAGVHQAVDLEPLIQKLRVLAAFHAEAIGEPAPAATAQQDGAGDGAYGQGNSASANRPAGDAGVPGAGVAGGAGAARAAAEIRSREDAVRELDRVCTYLERHEPANPAPLLIRRAQRLVQMNFLDILRDLAPEGMSSIEKIAGLPPAE